jgi:hypothetical protein
MNVKTKDKNHYNNIDFQGIFVIPKSNLNEF